MQDTAYLKKYGRNIFIATTRSLLVGANLSLKPTKMYSQVVFWMSKFNWLGLLLAASVSMCSANPNEKMMEVTHPNGLLLSLPQSLSIQQSSEGFLVQPQRYQEMRSPYKIMVTQHANKQRPKGEWPQFRMIDGRLVYYRIEKNEGGSDGQMYILKAWKAQPTGYIFLQQLVQNEDLSGPDFALGWLVIKGSRGPGLIK